MSGAALCAWLGRRRRLNGKLSSTTQCLAPPGAELCSVTEWPPVRSSTSDNPCRRFFDTPAAAPARLADCAAARLVRNPRLRHVVHRQVRPSPQERRPVPPPHHNALIPARIVAVAAVGAKADLELIDGRVGVDLDHYGRLHGDVQQRPPVGELRRPRRRSGFGNGCGTGPPRFCATNRASSGTSSARRAAGTGSICPGTAAGRARRSDPAAAGPCSRRKI